MRKELSDKMSLIESLSGVIYASLDRRLLRSAYQQPRYGERLYGYQECVQRACADCMRWYDGEVYYFDGRVWKVLDDVVLESALNRALVKAGVPKGDIVNSRSKLIYAARGGASLSPLGVSPAVVGFENGVWDFTDLDEPVYHSFEDRMPVTGILPYPYDPKAACPRWDAFLAGILPRTDIVRLQKYLGLGCVHRRAMRHKVEETLWLIGSGANGKSTIFDVVRAVYGADNISYMGMDSLLSGSSEVRARFIGSITGRLFNYCSEVQGDDITRYQDTFKALCSGEPQTVRRLGQNPETAYDIPFLIFNMNHRPRNRMLDTAMMRRLVQIPFRTTVSAAEMNRELSDELMEELPGIRNWMMEGYRMLERDGFRFGTTAAQDEELTEYMLENGQSVQVFLTQRGFGVNRRSGHWEDHIQWVPASALYEDYASFCGRMLQEPLTQRAFGGEMNRLGWSENAGNRKRTGTGYLYGIFCENDIDYQIRL